MNRSSSVGSSAAELGPEGLDRHGLAHLRVVGPVDHAHPAGAEYFLDVVAPGEARSDGEQPVPSRGVGQRRRLETAGLILTAEVGHQTILLPQLFHHLAEGAGQFADLVATADLDAAGVLPFAHLPGGGDQLADGAGDLAGHQHR